MYAQSQQIAVGSSIQDKTLKFLFNSAIVVLAYYYVLMKSNTVFMVLTQPTIYIDQSLLSWTWRVGAGVAI